MRHSPRRSWQRSKAWEDPIFCQERLGLEAPLGSIDPDKLNVTGSSLAAGHPFAATGGRIVATLAKLLADKGSGPRRALDLRCRRSRGDRDPGALSRDAAGRVHEGGRPTPGDVRSQGTGPVIGIQPCKSRSGGDLGGRARTYRWKGHRGFPRRSHAQIVHFHQSRRRPRVRRGAVGSAGRTSGAAPVPSKSWQLS